MAYLITNRYQFIDTLKEYETCTKYANRECLNLTGGGHLSERSFS